MWYLNINDSAASVNNINNKQLINSVYQLKNQKDIIDCLSQAMWNDVPDTYIKAIKAGFVATWLGLIDHLVKKVLLKNTRYRERTHKS